MAAPPKGGNHMEIVRAVQEKRPVPEIDFSLHTMEDGSQVSTQERVCKGSKRFVQFMLPATADAVAQMFKLQHIILPPKSSLLLHMIVASQICNF